MISEIYYRILSLQISRLGKRIHKLEQLEELEEEIEQLKEKLTGNRHCFSLKRNLLIVLLTKLRISKLYNTKNNSYKILNKLFGNNRYIVL